jgi:hypothetical protein
MFTARERGSSKESAKRNLCMIWSMDRNG